MVEDLTTRNISKDEMDLIFSAPAPFANKIFATRSGTAVRFTFAEGSEEPKSGPFLRATVALSLDEVFKLKLILDQITKDVQIEPLHGGVSNAGKQ